MNADVRRLLDEREASGLPRRVEDRDVYRRVAAALLNPNATPPDPGCAAKGSGDAKTGVMGSDASQE